MKAQAVKPLEIAKLYRRYKASEIPGDSTAELPEGDALLGQQRAAEAIVFGAGIDKAGYNIFVLADPEAGAMESVRQFLQDIAREGEVPPDWLYVQNYSNPRRPHVIAAPAGSGRHLQELLSRTVRELKATVPDIFEGDDYQERVSSIYAPMEGALQTIYDRASEAGLELVAGEDGFTFVPLRGNRRMRQDEIKSLSSGERRRLEQNTERLEAEMNELVRQLPRYETEIQEQLRVLNYEYMSSVIEGALDTVRGAFNGHQSVRQFLEEMSEDMIENVHLFVDDTENDVPIRAGAWTIQPADPLMRYSVNLIVDNSNLTGAPVVVEPHPTFSKLMGRMDQAADLGSLHSDFSMLRPGAMHVANGGFLLIDAEALLEFPAAWEALKICLKTEAVAIDTMREFLGDSDTGTIMPDAVPLNLKVVLFGDWFLHYALGQYDPDFTRLFRVQADFADSLARTKENEAGFARLIATLQRRNELRPFDKSGIARMIEESARMSEDSERLSLHLDTLSETMTEADFWAAQEGVELVTVDHIDKALAARRRRHGLHQDLCSEHILRDYKRIETTGTRVGQVNGLVVIGTPDYQFGLPSRITAQARIGSTHAQGLGQIIDVQRQVGKGGPSHSKGVLTLGGYLRGRYMLDKPLALSASLVFEQTYSGVDGDSASVAEMCALLSAISGIPLKQSIALTGAISQHGEVQAIGGVNDKIEGFFDICAARGLTGDQGVLIPAANVADLMLRADVVEACKNGKFFVTAVETVDQVMEQLTGMKAGRRRLGRRFPGNTINRRVEDRLKAFTIASQSPVRDGWM